MDAATIVEREVRELARRRGLDPGGDTEAVRDLVGEVLGDYADRATTADLPPLPDAARTGRAVLAAVAGYGPLQQFLDDPEVEEIWVNEPGRVFVARRGRSELTTTVLAPGQVQELVERMLRTSGRRVDRSAPFVDAMLPDGSRLHVVIPDVTRRHWAVNIRKFVVAARSLDELVRLGTVSAGAARFLDAAVRAGLNVVVSGATQAGKTTLLNCLAASIPAHERVVTCEEVFELQPPLPDVVAMQARPPGFEGTGEVTLRRLVTEALRMRPDRLIVGEVRREECLDLLLALNSGVPGMCSVHANSARDALVKLATLPLLAGPNVAYAFVLPTVAACVDVVVHLATDRAGRRHVHEVVAVPGRVENGVVETAQLFARRDGRLLRQQGRPPHPDRFAAAGVDLGRLLAEET